MQTESYNSTTLRPLLLIVVSGIVALFAVYWDDVWHTDLGRDDFTIPPHLLLYGAVTLLVMAIFWWLLIIGFQSTSPTFVGRLKRLLEKQSLMLSLAGINLTIIALPVDVLWHDVFGRDSVLWSPPHLLGVTGLVAVGAGALMEASQIRFRFSQILQMATGALVIGGGLVIVMEYETDVPQFAVFWYLPILTATVSLTFTLGKRVSPHSYFTTFSTLIYLVVRLLLLIFLIVIKFSPTPLFPLIVPALLFDFSYKLKWSLFLRAFSLTVAIYVTYVPFLNYFLSGFTLSLPDILGGIPLAIFLSWLVMVLLTPMRGKQSASASKFPGLIKRLYSLLFAVSVIGMVILFAPAPVFAHDPGQGEEVAQLVLSVSSKISTYNFSVNAMLTDVQNCERYAPANLIARQAGEVQKGVIKQVTNSSCQLSGTIELSKRGRWFVYIELIDRQTTQSLEAWLPILAGGEKHQSFNKTTSLYVPVISRGSSGEFLSGSFLYILNLLLLFQIVRVFRRTPAP
jgi:hypothetical protein